MAQQIRVGFIGLGAMGSGMAGRILAAGYPLTVYNRTQARTAPLAAKGARVADTPRAVAEDSDTVITMLADPAAVRAVLDGPDGILAGAHDGMTLLEMSTVGPLDARGTQERARHHGVPVIQASVLGPPAAAAQGTLTMLAGGDPELVEAQQPILSAMASTIVPFPRNEQAAALKLANNLLLLASLQLLGEAVELATGWGIPRERVLAFFENSAMVPPPVKARMRPMYDEHGSVDFALTLGRKDLWLATGAAYAVGSAAPLAAAALETFTLALRDHGDEDIARIGGFMAELSGRQ